MTRGGAAAIALFVLAGCAGGQNSLWRNEDAKPTVEVAPMQALGVPVDVARERADGWLSARGFAVRAAPDGLRADRATGADPAWSICPNPRVSSFDSDSNQSRPALLQDRQASVAVDLASAGDGSRATVAAEYRAVMLDTFRSRTFQTACRSTGVLERDLFLAMGSG